MDIGDVDIVNIERKINYLVVALPAVSLFHITNHMPSELQLRGVITLLI